VDAKAGSAQARPALEAEPRPLILVVDDDETFARSCVRVLETWGYGVETASDGSAALALARARKFDVVLTDIKSPT